MFFQLCPTLSTRWMLSPTKLRVNLVLLLFFLAPAFVSGQINSNWINSSGGVWSDANNWSTASFPNQDNPDPGDTYNATIDLVSGSNYQVTLSNPVSVENLTIDSGDATLVHTAGIFTANGAINLNNGTYQLRGGTIANSVVNQSGGALTFAGEAYSSFDDTTVNGDLTISNARAKFLNGGTFTGDANVSGTLVFEGACAGQPTTEFTLDNGGTINLNVQGSSFFGGLTDSNIELTLGSSVTVRGSGNVIATT